MNIHHLFAAGCTIGTKRFIATTNPRTHATNSLFPPDGLMRVPLHFILKIQQFIANGFAFSLV